MKKIISLCLALICMLGLAACNKTEGNLPTIQYPSVQEYNEKSVGIVSGEENEYILYNDVTYVKDNTLDYSEVACGKYLGNVINSEVIVKIYTVDGDEKLQYIYAMCEQEKTVYRRSD